MADVLSQNEIDALLSAISTGEMDADELKQKKDPKVKVYDFKRALRFSKEQIRSLTRIHENFARLLSSFLSAHLRTFVQVSVASVDQLSYEEFIRSVPKLTILHTFDARPLDGRLLIEMNPNIAYAMIDRVLGGRGSGTQKQSSLTEIETKIMKRLFSRTLDTFKEAWESIVPLEPVSADFEENPQFLQLASPNETVVVISLSTTVGEASGMMNICLPHVAIEPVIPKLSFHYWMQETKKKRRQPGEVEELKKKLHEAKLELAVELGRTQISVADFLQLAPGDILPLDQPIDAPLAIKIGHETKFTGQPGKKKNRMAVQIIESHMKGDGENE